MNAEILEYKRQIQALQEKIYAINPYERLRGMSIKEFGEEFAEQWVIDHSGGSVQRVDGKGFDLYHCGYGRIEVKASRKIRNATMNQLHPEDCDYFLFILFDIDSYEEEIYLVPSVVLPEICHLTPQHDRGANHCFSLTLSDKNKKRLISFRRTKDFIFEH